MKTNEQHEILSSSLLNGYIEQAKAASANYNIAISALIFLARR